MVQLCLRKQQQRLCRRKAGRAPQREGMARWLAWPVATFGRCRYPAVMLAQPHQIHARLPQA